jgi:hypothetical protein
LPPGHFGRGAAVLPKKTVTLSLSAESFEIAARILALTIHPCNDSLRERFYLASCHLTFREAAKDAVWASTPQIVQPKYLLFDHKIAAIAARRGMEIYNRERLIAAEMAFPFIVEFIKQKLFNNDKIMLLREGGKETDGLTLARVAAWAAEEQQRIMGKSGTVGEAKTVEQRAWRNTKPVLHLAIALHVYTYGTTGAERQAKFGALCHDKSQVVAMFEFAETLRVGLPAIFERRRLQLAESDMIRVTTES